jgi:hypothetical protein
MIRTIVSLDPEDKAWLERVSRREQVTMTQLVRRAVRRLRREYEARPTAFERILRETAGTWSAGDGLDYQRRVRSEWRPKK